MYTTINSDPVPVRSIDVVEKAWPGTAISDISLNLIVDGGHFFDKDGDFGYTYAAGTFKADWQYLVSARVG